MDRSDALLLGWFLIASGAAITLLRHRLAVYRRDLDSGRRGARPQAGQAGLTLNSVIFACLGVLLMLGGLLLIVEEPVLRLLHLK
jgi:hypothetical protein